MLDNGVTDEDGRETTVTELYITPGTIDTQCLTRENEKVMFGLWRERRLRHQKLLSCKVRGSSCVKGLLS